MVLLIACANLAGLTLARGVSREREVAIRAALGAGRGRLTRQFLTESMLLSCVGGTLGIAVAYFGILAVKAAMPADWLDPEANPAIDGGVVLFLLLLTGATGILSGLVPALRASRPDLSQSIRQSDGGASAARGSRSFRSVFVVAEVALTTILLVGAGLLARSFVKVQQADTGFDSTNVVTAWLPTSVRRFPTNGEFLGYIRTVGERVGSLPGVKDVALTSGLPTQGWGWGAMMFQVVGSEPVEPSLRPYCMVKMVTPSYFQTLGIRLVKGRTLADQDVKGAVPSVVINSTMARRLFRTTDPIGKQIQMREIIYANSKSESEIPWEIVGVVADEKFGGLSEPDEVSACYLTIAQAPVNNLALVVRGSMRPESLERSIAAAVHDVDPDQPLDDMKALDMIKSESLGNVRLRSALIAVFAGMALVLAAVGLYGVISYSVVQRTREIGIRVALGASPRKIAGLVIKRALALTLFGLVAGVAGAIGLARFLSSVLFEVSPYDPLALGTAVVILAVTALAACLIPVRRAIRLDPIIALRSE
jgi:putative ABC transport system permease protein